ncbi:hypothetical protein MPER_02649 [Moniliophthora perniciosa FA553]|nr:hypothetical protein MPER_02649 [Moniliophthora perniciosa FA553]
MADQRQRIIDSVFSRRNAAGNLEETYMGHVKIWEDAENGGRKPRYILLSQASNGAGFIHKSKLNTNGTFSVGKTWRLVELRGIQVVGPQTFNISLARTYRWQTENQWDQDTFLKTLIQLFYTVTGGPENSRNFLLNWRGTEIKVLFQKQKVTLSQHKPNGFPSKREVLSPGRD